jgi:hopene-associated glycosyltransferase HpnB
MGQSPLDYWPAVCVVIPARNEVDLIGLTIKSLLTQDYLGNFILILVDDDSTDGTAEVAQEMASSLGKGDQLQIIPSQPLPNGWTGKLWALDQGTRYAQSLALNPLYILLSDADIEHDRRNLSQLIMKAERESLDLVSLMVYLRCQSFWEKLLIPAFIFFFAKLYPFRQVNNPKNSTAAAAGGVF